MNSIVINYDQTVTSGCYDYRSTHVFLITLPSLALFTGWLKIVEPIVIDYVVACV